MALIMIYGVFAPSYLSALRDDPELAPAEVEKVAASSGCTVRHYFFAMDDNDFYAFVDGPDALALHTTRCLLMAQGHFARLTGDLLFEPGELLPSLNAASEAALGRAPY